MIALLSNDDGIAATGLTALRQLAGELFDEVWVVAPMSQMSQIGHRVTTDAPIRYEQKGERTFAVDGTPADCVRVALAHLLPVAPDWVLSGINHGGNLGRHDFVISGTVAAVREAAFQGIPGVTFSHYLRRGLAVDWEKAAERARDVVAGLLAEPPRLGHFWNVNLPHPSPGDPEPRIIRCEQERHPLLVTYREESPGLLHYAGDYHERLRVAGSDVDVCFGGNIAVTLASI
ncbi:MAG: 5'/3'-nucleotidase SurE [Verrucomicrobiia bacterium Tous-C2TDCM]|nr:MAG: 5'/3'-nucleotidase SurE [Verrucomicrobiae bacterium Tous-C2TDCM]